eukprot:6122356-Pyramimonas_sp.AAC.1
MVALLAVGYYPWPRASSQEQARHTSTGLATHAWILLGREKPQQFVVRLEAKPRVSFWELRFSDHGFQCLHIGDMEEGPMTPG